MNRRERRAAARGGHAAPEPAVAALLQQGMRRHEAGRLDEAAALYRQALAREADNPDALHLLGLVAHQKGDCAQAVELIGRAIARSPRVALYHNNIGAALRTLGRAAEAAGHFARAAALEPRDASARLNLGSALEAAGRDAEAAAAYRAALQLAPQDVDAHGALAALLARMGDAAGALHHATRAAEIAPGRPDVHNNLAGALGAAGRRDEAVAALRRAVTLAPDYAEAWINLGVLLRDLERAREAEDALRRGLQLRPGEAYGWETLGLALEDQGRLVEALESYRRSIAADPRHLGGHNNMGLTLRRLERPDEAIACYGRALAADPHYDHAANNRALALLAMGRFAEGWRDWRRRESIRGVRARLVQEPLPVDLHGRRILVWRDQGLGDEIFFLRFLPLLKARGAWIAYRAQPKIAPLLRGLEFIDRLIVEDREPEPQDVDAIVSAGDLPLLTGMESAADIPPSIRLSPPPERAAELRARLVATGPPPWVGVTWRAGVQQRNLLSKIAPQDAFAQALRGTNATLVALQRAPAPGEIARFADIAGRTLADFTALNDDLEDMLALLSLLDDHVCVSNTNVHLREAVGRPSRVLVPFPADYRWMDSGDESPWFPGSPVYRESRAGGWSEAMARLAADLAAAWPASGAGAR